MANRNYWVGLKRAAMKYWFGEDITAWEQPPLAPNNEYITAPNAANTALVDLIKAGADDAVYVGNGGSVVIDGDSVEIGGEVFNPSRQPLVFNLEVNASLTDQHFFIAPYACKITGITEIHKTAGNDAGAVTAVIKKCTGTQAPTAGTAVMSNTFNMKGTANTLQTATLTATEADLDLAAGDRLSIDFTGTVATLAGVVVTIALTPANAGDFAIFRMNANGDLIDSTAFFLANRPCIVTKIQYVHSTAGTNGSDVNLQITKDTSTNAPGAGTDLLTNDTDAGFDCKAAINTVQDGALVATAATLRLAVGDRLSADFAGTLTALAGVVVVVTLEPITGRREITFALAKNADLLDQAFFTADRPYEVLDISEVHATAGNDGGAVNLQVTIDKATDAPGAGVDLLTNNTNAGFDLKGTANTVQAGALVAQGSRIMLTGDRLSVDFAGTVATLAGVVVTASLKPI